MPGACGASPTIRAVALPDDAWVLLHEVRLRGVVPPGEPVDEQTVVLLVSAGYVARVPRGIRITPEGRVAHAGWARLDAASEVASTVERAYRRFLPLNVELVRLCHEWQVLPGGATNEHRDRAYDWDVLDRVRALDERIGPVVRHVGRAVPRFGTYRARLRHALTLVGEGSYDWLTSPRVDSYHTVWMQLHEDLLLALGLDRSSEDQSGDGSSPAR